MLTRGRRRAEARASRQASDSVAAAVDRLIRRPSGLAQSGEDLCPHRLRAPCARAVEPLLEYELGRAFDDDPRARRHLRLQLAGGPRGRAEKELEARRRQARVCHARASRLPAAEPQPIAERGGALQPLHRVEGGEGVLPLRAAEPEGCDRDAAEGVDVDVAHQRPRPPLEQDCRRASLAVLEEQQHGQHLRRQVGRHLVGRDGAVEAEPAQVLDGARERVPRAKLGRVGEQHPAGRGHVGEGGGLDGAHEAFAIGERRVR
mmetsp:Transcript_45112/g.141041  ORF Transcript_45112/g.141041 Transcript_45112/m.141041 type:complete len:261 (+) Transcript_45112:208-990(+)